MKQLERSHMYILHPVGSIFFKCKQFSIEFKTLYLFSYVRKIWIQLEFSFECVVKDKENGKKNFNKDFIFNWNSNSYITFQDD